MGADNVYLHNEFVLALLIKCQQGPTAVKMPKGKRAFYRTEIDSTGS